MEDVFKEFSEELEKEVSTPDISLEHSIEDVLSPKDAAFYLTVVYRNDITLEEIKTATDDIIRFLRTIVSISVLSEPQYCVLEKSFSCQKKTGLPVFQLNEKQHFWNCVHAIIKSRRFIQTPQQVIELMRYIERKRNAKFCNGAFVTILDKYGEPNVGCQLMWPIMNNDSFTNQNEDFWNPKKNPLKQHEFGVIYDACRMFTGKTNVLDKALIMTDYDYKKQLEKTVYSNIELVFFEEYNTETYPIDFQTRSVETLSYNSRLSEHLPYVYLDKYYIVIYDFSKSYSDLSSPNIACLAQSKVIRSNLKNISFYERRIVYACRQRMECEFTILYSRPFYDKSYDTHLQMAVWLPCRLDFNMAANVSEYLQLRELMLVCK